MVTLPDPSVLLQKSSEWFNPFFNEFLWVVYIVVGVTFVSVLINFLINLFDSLRYRYDADYRYESSRQDAIDRIKESEKINKDWELWKKSQNV